MVATAMEEESPARKGRSVITWMIAIVITGVCGWHAVCHVRLVEGLEMRANETLADVFEGGTVSFSIQPLTNQIEINLTLPTRTGNSGAQLLQELLLSGVVRVMEPELERQLATAVRSNVDVYAMLVPYHVAIYVENVRIGFSKVVQDVQKELLRLGFNIGEADGLNGPRTKQAISDVQAQFGIVQNGQASEELLSRLRKAETARSR